MNTKLELVSTATTGKRILDIPLDQLLPDPHQPREKFNEMDLKELATSIKNQGQQQLPTVNFAFKKEGKDHYYIRAGERRWRAHKKLEKPSMQCVVEEEPYDGKHSVRRRLAQAAENSSRVPHTHGEIIKLVEEVVQDVVKERGVQYGAIQIGLERVAKAFGKSLAWATGYHTLTGLLPELREMLDEDTGGNRLNFSVGTALARAPTDVQLKLLRDAEPYFKKGGHAAGYSFIVRKVREIRESRGEKVRGRGSDDRIRLVRTVERLRKLGDGLVGDRRTTEYRQWVESLLKEISLPEISIMLSEIKQGLWVFAELRNMCEARKKGGTVNLSVVKK